MSVPTSDIPAASVFATFAAEIGQSLLLVSSIGSLLMVAALLLHLFLSRFVAARWMYLLWLVVLIRFVIFFAPESPTSFLNLLPAAMNTPATTNISAVSVGLPATDAVSIDANIVHSAEIATEHNDFSQGQFEFDEAMSADSRLSVPTWTTAKLWTITAVTWIAGVAFMMIRLLMGHRHVRRIIQKSAEAEPNLQKRFRDVKKQISNSSRASLRMTSDIEVPSMVGFVNPIVLLPSWCVDQLTDDQLDIIFAHELVHIRRFDGLIQLATHLIVVLHWFNPLVRVAAGLAASARELSCDRRVVEQLSRNSLRSKSNTERCYGETIIDIATHVSRNSTSESLSPVILAGFVDSNQKQIKQRIAMLVKTNPRKHFATVIAAVSIVILVAVGFTTAETSEPKSIPITSEPLVASPEVAPRSSTPALLLPAPVPAVEKSQQKPQHSEQRALPPSKPKFSSQALLRIDGTIIEMLPVTPATKDVNLVVGQKEWRKFESDIPEITIDNPEVVSIFPMAPNKLVFDAIAAGTSTVKLTMANQKHEVIEVNVNVIADVSDLSRKITERFPDCTVNIRGTTEGFAVLTGKVPTERILDIEKFAAANSTLPLRNHLTDKDLIAMEVRVYEVNVAKMAKVEFDWSKIRAGLEGNITSVSQLFAKLNGNQLIAGEINEQESKLLNQFLESLTKHGASELLNQPVLVARDGQPAEFFHGDEIPIAVLQQNGETKIEFRSVGTKIDIVPKVHSKESLTLEVVAEVSEIAKDLSNANGVPGFRVRRVNSGAMVSQGESMILVGDFRTNSDNEEDSEIVFLITPRIIEEHAFNDPPNRHLR
jgi:beta-lactamase regulating signal transducer with metallopeptidase domain/Flp pilus assembly secretin CpaC